MAEAINTLNTLSTLSTSNMLNTTLDTSLTLHNHSNSNDSLGSLLTNVSMTSPTLGFGNDLKQRIKLKKDAMEYVDYMKEYQQDPKYKTEMCKSWSETGFCAYGNKCRFAHGKQELFDKVVACKKYKQKDCLSFFKNKYCCYGSRCHFRHEERRLNQIERSYYHHFLTNLQSSLTHDEVMNMSDEMLTEFILFSKGKAMTRRLPVFSNEQKVTHHIPSHANQIPQMQMNQVPQIPTLKSKKYLTSIENYNNTQPRFTLNYYNLLPLF